MQNRTWQPDELDLKHLLNVSTLVIIWSSVLTAEFFNCFNFQQIFYQMFYRLEVLEKNLASCSFFFIMLQALIPHLSWKCAHHRCVLGSFRENILVNFNYLKLLKRNFSTEPQMTYKFELVFYFFILIAYLGLCLISSWVHHPLRLSKLLFIPFTESFAPTTHCNLPSCSVFHADFFVVKAAETLPAKLFQFC